MQEAIPVGAMAVREASDNVVATYRGHGWALACGIPPLEVLAEILGREGGVNGGRGGSAYLADPARGFLGENSIVGAGVPIAGGAALPPSGPEAPRHAGELWRWGDESGGVTKAWSSRLNSGCRS